MEDTISDKVLINSENIKYMYRKIYQLSQAWKENYVPKDTN